jgi:hypothetical protein
MGTRADFYMGRGLEAEWLGSIAWDGYPAGFLPDLIRRATSEAEYRATVEDYLSDREDGTTPSMGWPWPWDDSSTTDYAYAFDDGKVWASCFGDAWFPATEEDEPESDGPKAVFPDMSGRSAFTLGPRSGVTVFMAGESPNADSTDENR